MAASGAHEGGWFARLVGGLERRAATWRASVGGAAATDVDAAVASLTATLARSSATRTHFDEALEHARRAFGLDANETCVLGLLTLVEIEPRVRWLLAVAADGNPTARPTIRTLLDGLDASAASLSWFAPDAPLIDNRLVQLEGTGPFDGRVARVDDELWPRLVTLVAAPAALDLRRVAREALVALALAPNDAERAREIAAHVATADRAPVVAIVGPAGTGRETLACAIAAAAGFPSIVIDERVLSDQDAAARLAREARWYEAAIVVVGEAPGASVGLGWWLKDLERPLFWICERGALEAVATRREVVTLAVSRPDALLRRELWSRATAHGGSHVDSEAIEQVAGRFRFGPGRITAATRLARARAASAGRLLDPGDLAWACRTLPGGTLGDLAERLPETHVRADLIVGRETGADLDLLIATGRHMTVVRERWGVGQRGASGIACLMAGPPGTGKTMAAQIVGRELGLDVYRVDLSRVVSKYIGETEKNLARVFDEAEAAAAILFFDEADALFGKRTEVKDAHDRYANLEISFLLQRIEAHPGITLLASNLRENIDAAFLRRMHVVVDFVRPQPAERLAIWQRHLPANEHLAQDIDLSFLANRFDLTGAEIAKAVLTGAVLAADATEALGMRHLVIAVARILRKAGRIVTRGEFGAWENVIATPSLGHDVRTWTVTSPERGR